MASSQQEYVALTTPNMHNNEPQRPRGYKRTVIVSLIVALCGIVAVVVSSHDGHHQQGISDTTSITPLLSKSDALHERMNALDYMDKKRHEEYPKKKKSLRASSYATQGDHQLDPLLTKEDVVVVVGDAEAENDLPFNDVLDLVVDDNDKEQMQDMPSTINEETKTDALEKRMDALGYMEKKRKDEHPKKKTSLRSSSSVTKMGQLDPLFAKEELVTPTATSELEFESGFDETDGAERSIHDDDNQEEIDTTPRGDADDENDVNSKDVVDDGQVDDNDSSSDETDLSEHVDALTYMDKKRQENYPQKPVSLRSSSVITKGQELDPMFAKTELAGSNYDTSLTENDVDDDEQNNDDEEGFGIEVNAVTEPFGGADGMDEHMDALAYMDKKREEEKPKKASIRASSVVTKQQLDPLLAKEELKTPASAEVDGHVDSLEYMDKKRQHEKKSKQAPVRSSAAVIKDQLDPLLAKEELVEFNDSKSAALSTAAAAGDHLDGLEYMDKKRQAEHPNKASSVRSSSAVTKGQLDPLLAKEELVAAASGGKPALEGIVIVEDGVTDMTTERSLRRQEKQASEENDNGSSGI